MLSLIGTPSLINAKKKGLSPKYVVGLNGSDGHLESIIDLITVRGRIAIIDDPPSLDLTKYSNFKLKALSFSWEFMFVRSLFKAENMDAQYELLTEVSTLIDAGDIIPIATSNLGTLTLITMKACVGRRLRLPTCLLTNCTI